ncbi:MAG: hypothetical protein ACOH1E_05790 [Brevundimonas sp.]
MPMIDESVAVLKAVTLAPGDMVAAERRARAVGTLARSVRAVLAMTPPSRTGGESRPEEDEMRHRDDSPENLERMRAELEARLDRLNAVLEAKGIVVEPGCWPVARPDRERLHPA